MLRYLTGTFQTLLEKNLEEIWGCFFYPPPKTASLPDLRDGPILGQDIFSYGYFDCSEHVPSTGLVLEASYRAPLLPEVVEA